MQNVHKSSLFSVRVLALSAILATLSTTALVGCKPSTEPEPAVNNTGPAQPNANGKTGQPAPSTKEEQTQTK